jgi:hypothetical protein
MIVLDKARPTVAVFASGKELRSSVRKIHNIAGKLWYSGR